jgi:hypothetical protein
MNDQVDFLVGHARTTRWPKAMRRLARSLCWVLWLGLGSSAQAKTCEEVKADIAAGMDASGLSGYSLQIVPAGTPLAGGRAVGNCAGGSRQIVYRRFALQQVHPLVSEALLPPSPQPSPSPAAPAPVAVRPLAPVPVPVPAAPVAVVQVSEPAPPTPAAQAAPASQSNEAPPASASLAPAFLAKHWTWLGGLLVLPLLVWLWRWRVGGVDAAGLPRGPRL